MVKKNLQILSLASIVFSSLAFDLGEAEGWIKAGSKPKSYEMGVDKGAGEAGGNCAAIKSKDRKIDGFGTLMQSFKPDKYLGKKIKMTGSMKSNEVANWSGFWLRVDGEDKKKSLSFDNMYDRAVKGTTEWTKYEIILSVPDSATNISFGALLNGTGTIWFDNLNFEVVDNSTPETKKPKIEPTNLNFEK